VDIEPGIRARLRNAGHILGSSILELWFQEGEDRLKVVFSGDLGRKDQLIVQDPQEIFDADVLFMESTYGNRNHRSFEQSRQELLEAIQYSVSHGQKILIPAFAVERTQEILYILGELQREGSLPDIPIYLDSPLAIKATEIFRKNKSSYDREALAIVNSGFDPFDMDNLKLTESTRESMSINEHEGPAIVIAGNGMCTAGRIRHHLKHNLWCKGASVVIVGFQAAGTTGRKLVDGARRVKILGETISVNARIYTIGGFSAHADQQDLVQWVGNFTSNPQVFLIHGEEESSRSLAQTLESSYGLNVHIPKWKERLLLKPREVVEEVPDLSFGEPDVATQAQNALIDLENELKALKKRIKAKESVGELEEDDIGELQFVQEEIRALLNS
jgi:metallo-beta-lactamase family protein